MPVALGGAVPCGITHTAHFKIGGVPVVFVMPGADPRPGRASPRVFFIKGVFSPIVEFQRIATIQSLRAGFLVFGIPSPEQPPRSVEPCCAGSKYGIRLSVHFLLLMTLRRVASSDHKDLFRE